MLSEFKRFILKSEPLTNILSFLYRLMGRNYIRKHRGLSLSWKGAFAKGCRIYNRGTNNKIFIARGCRLSNCTLEIVGDNNRLEIGYDTVCDSLSVWVSDASTVEIGDRVEFAGETHVASLEGTTVHIGGGCLFSSGIRIRSGDSHAIVDKEGSRINPAADVWIGNHVWLGQQVVVLKGASIGDNSVIGLRSLLTGKSFPKGSLIAGAPGKVIREGVSWQYSTKEFAVRKG